MSSPIPIPSSSRTDASLGLYVPIHRRTPSSYSSSSGTPSASPSPSSSSSALPTIHAPGVYTPAELLALSQSPLIAELSVPHLDAIRTIAPEVVQTRKQRKALAWRARQPTHGRTPSHGSHSHASESEEDRAVSWRRT